MGIIRISWFNTSSAWSESATGSNPKEVNMTRENRERQRRRAQAHQRQQRERRATALSESEDAAKKAKKGKKGIVTQMARRGYELMENGKYRRMTKLERAEAA